MNKFFDKLNEYWTDLSAETRFEIIALGVGLFVGAILARCVF